MLKASCHTGGNTNKKKIVMININNPSKSGGRRFWPKRLKKRPKSFYAKMSGQNDRKNAQICFGGPLSVSS